MKQKIERVEAIIAGLKSVRELVRQEIESGASLHHVYDQLNEQHQAFSSRLVELRQHRDRVEPSAARRDGHTPNPVTPETP